jgi:hypothetical protein
LRRVAVALRATERTALPADRVLAAALRRADAVALPTLRATAFTFRLAVTRRFFDTFGNIRRAPRTALRAVPVAAKATPAAISVAIEAALPAAPLIVSPAVVIMPFFAIC